MTLSHGASAQAHSPIILCIFFCCASKPLQVSESLPYYFFAFSFLFQLYLHLLNSEEIFRSCLFSNWFDLSWRRKWYQHSSSPSRHRERLHLPSGSPPRLQQIQTDMVKTNDPVSSMESRFEQHSGNLPPLHLGSAWPIPIGNFIL